MGCLKAIITDFDGTLVDTIEANVAAYKQTFIVLGLSFDEKKYRASYGLRVDHMIKEQGIDESWLPKIKKLKSEIYPQCFKYAKLNKSLLEFIKYSKSQGLVTCIASTAAKTNLINILKYFNILDVFDYIISGEDVVNGKPDPEVYNKALEKCQCKPHEAITFEDSIVGVKSAVAAGLNYMIVKFNE